MKVSRLFPWFVWAIAVSFFAFQFILRLLPGLVMPQVMAKFQIDASSYGLLSSMYYFGYAGAQLPIAFCLDRYGPKRVVSLCILLCSLSTLLSASTSYWPAMLAGRFLIGVGSAAGFLGTAKVVSQWFDGKHYARMLGITFSFGLLGAVYGGKPVALWISSAGWENVMTYIAFIGTGIGLLAAVFIKETGPQVTSRATASLADLRRLFTNKNLILLGVCNLLMVGTLEGFADVWGVPYLARAYSLQKEDAAFFTSMIFVGMLFGGPILALLAEKSQKFFEVTAASGVISAGLMVVLLFTFESHHPKILTGFMFFAGILCCYQVLILTIGSRAAPPSMLGITTAFLNCINMLGGAFFHGSIGLLLDFGWTQELEIGIRAYSVQNFQAALLIIPTAGLLGAMGVMHVKNKMSPKCVAIES